MFITDLRKNVSCHDMTIKWLMACVNALNLRQDIEIALVHMRKPISANGVDILATTELLSTGMYRISLCDQLYGAELRTAICHECIHVKQYEDGRLVKTSDGKLFFDGHLVTPPYNMQSSHEDEAYRDGKKLARTIR